LLGGWKAAVTDRDGRYEIESEEPFYNVAVCIPNGLWVPNKPFSWFRRMQTDRETGADIGLTDTEPDYP